MIRPLCAIVVVTLCGFLCLSQAMAQEPVKEKASDLVTQEAPVKRDGYALAPYLVYTPETLWAGGLAGVLYFRLDTAAYTRPSSVSTAFIVSIQNQYGYGAYPELYFDEDRVRTWALVEAFRYPNFFFGIGDRTVLNDKEPYTPQGVRLNLHALINTQGRSVTSGLNVGVQAIMRYDNISGTGMRENGLTGLLDSRTVLGSRGGVTTGLGLMVNMDTRDSIFYPRNGSLFDASLTRFSPLVGSDYIFTLAVLDYRAYRRLGPLGGVVAFQALQRINIGAPPYYMLAMLGGPLNSRGYFMGRYRDLTATVVQAEYRLPLFWRIGMVAFGSAGDVAPRLLDYDWHNLKYAGGFGFRFAVKPEENLNLRLDVGFGRDESHFYLGFQEAF